ncbi:glycerophosphodiester phosphodiesterase [Methylocaldum szegediense]|nr:glycerophosphodiester phosphodiesterase [Methylocaldum szegediense]
MPPIVIAHRGASGYLPEHTLAAYERAIEQGADFIEPDLVSTKDGVLIVRHELNITETTNVSDHSEFAARRTTKVIDGTSVEGWFADDFTLAEIKTLRARQRLPFRPQQFNDLFEIPTFEEVISLAKRESERRGRVIGIYPETKHPSYHRSVGLPLEEKLVETLKRHGWADRTAPVVIQSFETANLRALRKMTGVRLVQLIDGVGLGADGSPLPGRPYDFEAGGDSRTYADLLTEDGLAEIRTYADGIGPWKRYLVGAIARAGADESEAKLLAPSSVIRDAHKAGLFVHAWTFRNDPQYLATDYGGDPLEEYRQFYRLGVDGVFSDFPDTAIAARAAERNQ